MAIEALTDPEAVALLEAAALTRNPARDTAIVAVCLDAGPRRGELVAARAADYDAASHVLRIGHGATARAIRLGEVAGHALRSARSSPAQHALITSSAGQPITPRVVHEQLLSIGARAGLGDGITSRHLRRTYGANILGTHDAHTALRLLAHGSKRFSAASLEEALAEQIGSAWRSPLDRIITRSALSRAA